MTEQLGVIEMQNQKLDPLGADSGFTLVELIIALTVSLIVGVATYSAYRLQVKTSVAQDSVTDMQQNLRSAMSLLTQDLRMAGYDPLESGDFAFVNNEQFSNGGSPTLNETVSTHATQIAFTMDHDSDGVVDKVIEDVNGDGVKDITEVEQVSYRLNGMQFERYTTTFAGASTTASEQEWQLIGENIEAVEFRYTLDDGTQTLAPGAAELHLIRGVEISMLARSERRDPGYVNNNVYTPASGTAWDLSGDPNDGSDAPGDNFRRRLLITNIQCRNMGI